MLKPVSRYLALVCVLSIPLAAGAKNASRHTPKATKSQPAPASKAAPKWDIFAGYSYLLPRGTVQTRLNYGGTQPFSYVPVYGDAIGSYARFFTKHWGAEALGDIHLQNEAYTGKYVPQNEFSGASLGVIYRFRNSPTTPFVHLLMGGEIADGPHWQLDHWGPVVTVGGGMDCETPWFKHHMSIRLFQADYQFVHEDWGSGIDEGIGNINALRLSAGAVFHGASPDVQAPLALSCSVNQASVYPGAPVTLTATTANLNPRKSVSYSWSGSGVTGNGSSATVNTSSLAPGTYTVKGEVREDKPTRECLRVIPPQYADCETSFVVKRFEPPTITCSANPSTIQPGETSTVTAVAVSPQDRPLTYTYSASAGSISGNGAIAAYNSAGAPTGPVEIACNVTDDLGQLATAPANLAITLPVIAVPHTEALCSISFSNDKARPTRVDNEAKACLDEVALDLEKQPDAKVVIAGNDTASEKAGIAKQKKAAKKNNPQKVVDPAAERAVNTKEYLVTEKGIDPSRISVVTGQANGQQVENYLVPAGADFAAEVPTTRPVNESAVKPVVRKPLPLRHAPKQAATKKAASRKTAATKALKGKGATGKAAHKKASSAKPASKTHLHKKPAAPRAK
jgi:hypothetical protein